MTCRDCGEALIKPCVGCAALAEFGVVKSESIRLWAKLAWEMSGNADIERQLIAWQKPCTGCNGTKIYVGLDSVQPCRSCCVESVR